MLSYENADWKAIKEISKELDLSTGVLAQTYIDCVEEVNGIWDSLTDNIDAEEEEPQATQ